ncbi:hypothetical protein ACFL6U_21075, partial [Planctomycetota bacterium]
SCLEFAPTCLKIDGSAIHAWVSSTNGDISLTGQGGDTGDYNVGIVIVDLALIESTGTGANAGTITIDGTGRGVDSSEGVFMAFADIASVDGAIQITGLSTATGEDNAGIEISDWAIIGSTGTGLNAAMITLIGTGGGTDNSEGVEIQEGSEITSVDGAISITGNTTATGEDNPGIEISEGAWIVSFGSGLNAATITLDGTGNGTDGSDGVFIEDTFIESIDGAIRITGRTHATGENNAGIVLDGESDIVSFGTGALAATITLFGTGGGTDNCEGIEIQYLSWIASIDGAITLTGLTTATGQDNEGIEISEGALIGAFEHPTLPDTGLATITLTGPAQDLAVVSESCSAMMVHFIRSKDIPTLPESAATPAVSCSMAAVPSSWA